MKVGELRTYSRRVNLVAKVVEKGETREVVFRGGRCHQDLERICEPLQGEP